MSTSLLDTLISLVLALIMFGIGASIRWRSLKETFTQPKGLLIGLALQMLFLPVLAFLVVYFSTLSPELKVGIMILSFCPGGTNSNFISYLVEADVPLSIGLTSINSLLILITIPVYTNLSLEFFMDEEQSFQLPFLRTAGQVFLVVLLPAALGVFFRARFAPIALKLEKPLKWVNIALLTLVYTVKLFGGEAAGGSGITIEQTFSVLPAVLTIHLLSMLISYAFARRSLQENRKAAVTIGIEVALQNTTLTLLITGTIIGNQEMTHPALVVTVFSFFTTFLFALIATRFELLKRF